jgi:hypothetical protein
VNIQIKCNLARIEANHHLSCARVQAEGESAKGIKFVNNSTESSSDIMLTS